MRAVLALRAPATARASTPARVEKTPPAAPPPRSSRGGGVAAAVALSAAVTLASPSLAATPQTMYVAGGANVFLEKEFNDLRYAGVLDVVPGLATGVNDDGTPVEAVAVTYDADRLAKREAGRTQVTSAHEVLMRVYWKRADPTRTDGQFKENGARYRPAIWVSNAEERAEVETNARRLAASGVYGGNKGEATAAIAIPIVGSPAPSFAPAPAEDFGKLAKNPKLFEKEQKTRDAAFKDLWGFVQFCADRVCGYVRFAPKCVGECLDVFPEYRERNFGVPELTGNIKITSK